MGDVQHLDYDDCVITVDRRRMPILLVTWRGRPNERAIHGYFERVVDVCQRAGRQKFIAISDARAASVPTASVRKLMGDKIAETRPATEAVLLGGVVIVKTAVMRGALTAIQWALRGENRIVAVSDYPSAFDIALGVLRRAEIQPPTDLSVPLYDLSRARR